MMEKKFPSLSQFGQGGPLPWIFFTKVFDALAGSNQHNVL